MHVVLYIIQYENYKNSFERLHKTEKLYLLVIGIVKMYILCGRIVLALDQLESCVHQNNEYTQNIFPYKSNNLFIIYF